MKRAFIFTLVLALCGAFFPTQSLAAAKAGAPCKKAKLMSVSGGKLYTCVKSGKKLVWNKGEVISKTLSYDSAPTTPRTGVKKTDEEKSSPSAGTKWPVPSKLPSSFADLYENREGISYSAWLKTAKAMSANAGKVPPLDVLIGPNTKPWSSNHEEVIKQVSQAFPNQITPKKVYVIFHNFSDQSWAESKIKEIVTADEFSQWNRDEGGALVASNCQPDLKDCLGAKAKNLRNNEIAFALMGVSNQVGMLEVNGSKYGNPGVAEANQKGMVLAHEYLHNLQFGPISLAQSLQRSDFPPAWISEGTATLVQNAVINSASYEKFMSYRSVSLGELIERQGIEEEFIKNFLSQKAWIAEPSWGGVSPDWSYQLGARVMEVLISLAGTDSALEIYNLMSKKTGFDATFKTIYGVSFEEAVPVIAKALAANWKAGL
jgi:hypothetical protein